MDKLGLDPNNLDRAYNLGRVLAYIDYALGYNGLPNNIINNYHNLNIFFNFATRIERMIRSGLTSDEQSEYLELMARVRQSDSKRTMLSPEEQSTASIGRFHQYAAKPHWKRRIMR